jgi:hypothetical protein
MSRQAFKSIVIKKKKLGLRGVSQLPNIFAKNNTEYLLMQVRKNPEPLPHPYIAAS